MITPRLNPSIVADDSQLAVVIDEVLRGDAKNQKHRTKILELQDQLRRHVDDETWRVFLQLDPADAARMSDLSIALVQWGFTEGLEYGRRLRGNGR